MKVAVSFSGGKDSTAMLLLLMEQGADIDHVFFFDTGWEFQGLLKHVSIVENMLKKEGIQFVRLSPRRSFEFMMFDYITHCRDGTTKKGKGWPKTRLRWCTGEKQSAIKRHLKNSDLPVAIGFAADENRRKGSSQTKTNGSCVYPLEDAGVTEAQALRKCYKAGLDFGGLYNDFGRVSCFCCPLGGLPRFRTLRRKYGHSWKTIAAMVFQALRTTGSIPELR